MSVPVFLDFTQLDNPFFTETINFLRIAAQHTDRTRSITLLYIFSFFYLK